MKRVSGEMSTGETVGAPQEDQLVACVAQVAQHFGIPFSPNLLKTLARDTRGRLPFHQAGAALELIGLNYEARRPHKLPVRPDLYPAIVLMADGGVLVAHEARSDELLVWRPGQAEAVWVPLAAIAQEYGGEFLTVIGDPDSLRDLEAPWHAKGRHHWFWSELRKESDSFRSVWLASLLINCLALALPLFSRTVYDRVIPNNATATLWVLATGVVIAMALQYALRIARSHVVDQIGQRLDLKLSQKIYSRVLAMPLSSKRGSTGALAARVSEYAMVRDFFGSTTVVLIVDLAFLFLFVVVIAYIASWLALIPLTMMACMAIAGYQLQKKVVGAVRDVQADHGMQQTLLVESIAGMETLKSMAGEGGMVGRWYRLAEFGTASQKRLRAINTAAVSLAGTFQQLSTISLIIGGFYLFKEGKITMGAIIAIVMLASRSLAPAGQIAFLLTRGRQAREAIDSIERLFEAEDERKLGSPPACARATSSSSISNFAIRTRRHPPLMV